MTRRLALVLRVAPEVFAAYARSNNWSDIETRRSDDADENRPVLRWQVPGGEVRCTDDQVIGVQYVDIDADDTDSVENVIREEFTCYDTDDCLNVFDLDDLEETVCHTLRLLACTVSGKFDQRVLDATQTALRDGRDNVRVHALQVATSTEWPQFLDEVTRLTEQDLSEMVRGFARNARIILTLANSGTRRNDHADGPGRAEAGPTGRCDPASGDRTTRLRLSAAE